MSSTNPPTHRRRAGDEEKEGWRLDKHIPIAVIIAIFAQGVGVIWWGSTMQHAVADHERRLSTQEATKVTERMAVMEAQMKDSRELQIQMNNKLDKIIESRYQQNHR